MIMDNASTSIVKELVEKSWTHVTFDTDAVTSLCVQLVESRKNVECLIEDSLHCFRELSNGRSENASHQCCVSLHLMGLIVSHLSATPSGYEVKSFAFFFHLIIMNSMIIQAFLIADR
jgi:hypothetical protein